MAPCTGCQGCIWPCLRSLDFQVPYYVPSIAHLAHLGRCFLPVCPPTSLCLSVQCLPACSARLLGAPSCASSSIRGPGPSFPSFPHPPMLSDLSLVQASSLNVSLVIFGGRGGFFLLFFTSAQLSNSRLSSDQPELKTNRPLQGSGPLSLEES